ncbi:HlyD family type I secretion periplasmic adaptor subunit [Flaviflagellibacter deserti]|uniref:Membrane fusion protein (MFP) family protein n=1 Tax=Flaviflagellibacter deserti TaxID=2267266 RepID=A0ABV9Z4V5_9HYPH
MSRAESNSAGDFGFHIGRRVVAGILLSMLLIVGCGSWAVLAELSGAIVAQGSVKIDRNLKAIQHRDGGIIGEISVREGDFVQKGQVLLRLDDAQTRAELSIIRAQLIEMTARRARLAAERDMLSELTFPQGFVESSAEASAVATSETNLFKGNLTHRQSQKEQLELRVAQVEKEIAGLEAQRVAKVDEIKLIDSENTKLKHLLQKGLIENLRVYNTDREAARLLGSRGEVEAGIARANATMSEIRLQIIAVDQTSRTEAQRELSAVEAKISELNERRIAVEDRLSRTDIRAPLSGYINEVSVHTIGGVITPAERLITIVPENATLRTEAKLIPGDIDQVATGQHARLRFSAFNRNATPELSGQVVYVSPATTRDTVTGDIYYIADIEVSAEEMARLGERKLIPGMPVEVYISTDQRTALSYLTKPFVDQVKRAFREE